MMAPVPQLVGESEFSEFFGKSRFSGGNLTVFEVRRLPLPVKPPDKKLKNQIGVNHD